MMRLERALLTLMTEDKEKIFLGHTNGENLPMNYAGDTLGNRP